MSLRLYRPGDYPTVKQWWEEWGWQPVPEHALPPVGALVEDIACAWLYRTDSSIAIIDWFVTNKQARDGRQEAKAAIIHALSDIARHQGFQSVITFVRNPHLLKSFEDAGFEGKDTGITNLGRSLG